MQVLELREKINHEIRPAFIDECIQSLLASESAYIKINSSIYKISFSNLNNFLNSKMYDDMVKTFIPDIGVLLESNYEAKKVSEIPPTHFSPDEFGLKIPVNLHYKTVDEIISEANGHGSPKIF